MKLITAIVVASIACAQTTPSFFGARLYPALEAARCRMCHARDGVASATRLHFPEKDATASSIAEFGLSLAPLKSLLLDKPTNRIRHTGGQLVKPGSDEEKLLTQWVEYLASAKLPVARSAERAAEPAALVRRLTHSQYNNTVRDLLGDYSKPAQRFPTEDYVDGFKNQLRHQAMPPLLVEAYRSEEHTSEPSHG